MKKGIYKPNQLQSKEQVKEDQNQINAKFIIKQREADNQKVKDDQNERKLKSTAKQRAADHEKVKEGQNQRMQSSLPSKE